MFYKIIIIIVTVQQILKDVSCRDCSDCKDITKCPPALFLIKYKRDADSQKIITNAFCGYNQAEEKYQVCCSDFGTMENLIVKSGIEPQDTQNKIIDKKSLLPESCGDINGDRIVGGSVAGLYEFPWMALLSYFDKGTTTNYTGFECGGSVINSRYILTAAHCINNRLIGVRLGEYDISTKEDCYQNMCETHIQDVGVEKTIVHEKWNSARKINDIALIRVDEDIDLSSSNVQPICLPIYPNLQTKNLIGERATVSGWGKFEAEEASAVLLKVTVPIASCKEGYRTHICAGEKYRDSCSGDSGGPLVLEESYGDSISMVQFGIVSYGSRICGGTTKAIYTDVRQYVDWILEKIEP
ncbi:melanization protease 1-like [Colias croceus]|uniref:melanization protease 1-like n=1 Tax=Colias crocea TaxID=72248 RepID=UPI001E27B4A7|nr:melanization protease 1-like [Colias croceus]